MKELFNKWVILFFILVIGVAYISAEDNIKNDNIKHEIVESN